MTERNRKLYLRMVEFDRGMPALIQHFTKVHAYAALIAAGERMEASARECLEAAALVHDIAIPLCIHKYGSGAGAYQEKEGPALVREMLHPLNYDDAFIDRVCWLVAHHHTLTNINTLDHQILIEADYLVNAFEGNQSQTAQRQMLETIFKTPTAKTLLQNMFAL